MRGLDPEASEICFMQRLPRSVDDPAMRKLVALMHEELPNSACRARVHLLERLSELERDAWENDADPETIRSIHAVQTLVQGSDPLMSSAML